MLAAYGLTRLTRSSETATLVDIGGTILGALVSNYMTPRSPDNDRPRGMILEGCYNGPSGFADANELV